MQTTASVLVRMNIFLWFDARTTALNYKLEFTEPNLFNPTEFSNERRCPALRLVERYLADGHIQSASSFVTNMYNYTTGCSESNQTNYFIYNFKENDYLLKLNIQLVRIIRELKMEYSQSINC